MPGGKNLLATKLLMVYVSLSAKMVNKLKGQIQLVRWSPRCYFDDNSGQLQTNRYLEYKGNWYYLGEMAIHHWRTNYRRLRSTDYKGKT